MTLLEISIVAIAIVNVALLAAMIVLVMRLRTTLDVVQSVVKDHAVPVIDTVHRVADKVNGVAEQVQRMAGDVRNVEQRVAGTAHRVMDEIEPPVRQIAALLAGVRSGVGRLFEASERGRAYAATMRQDMRKE